MSASSVPVGMPPAPEGGVWGAGVDGVRVVRRISRRVVDGGGRGVWFVGAHGGAGASTWARLCGGFDGRGAWPVVRGGAGVDVVVCARSTVAGLRAAQLVGIEWAAGELPGRLLGLIVGADAPGKLPREGRAGLEVASGAFPNTVFVPFQASWRLHGMEGEGANRSRQVDKVAAMVAAWQQSERIFVK